MQNHSIGQHLALVRCLEITQEYNDLVKQHSLRVAPLTIKNFKQKVNTPLKTRCAVRWRLAGIAKQYQIMIQEMNNG